jgi:hypothetical protein
VSCLNTFRTSKASKTNKRIFKRVTSSIFSVITVTKFYSLFKARVIFILSSSMVRSIRRKSVKAKVSATNKISSIVTFKFKFIKVGRARRSKTGVALTIARLATTAITIWQRTSC